MANSSVQAHSALKWQVAIQDLRHISGTSAAFLALPGSARSSAHPARSPGGTSSVYCSVCNTTESFAAPAAVLVTALRLPSGVSWRKALTV